jgi:hypothetical protein
MATFEAVGEQFPDPTFHDYWGGHALADCLEGDPAMALRFPYGKRGRA